MKKARKMMEIKEAVEIADKFNDTIFTNTEEMVRAVETLLDLAKQYLDIKEPFELDDRPEITEWVHTSKEYTKGFNEALHLCKLACIKCKGEREQMKKLEEYNELIMAVGKKYPNETRHETALRYIRNAELSDSSAHMGRK
jgi:hypothetical protein